MKFGDLFRLYYERHAKTRTRCPENAFYFYKVHGPRWESVPVAEITRFALQDWVDELGLKSRSSATRAINMMSAILNWGIRRGYVPGPNPCVGVERFSVRARERFLMPEELVRFRLALDAQPARVRDFFYMCLLTGARRGNVQSMRWDELDLDLAIWQFDTKNGDRQCLPLCSGALAILSRRKEANKDGSPWVFPGRRPGSHLIEPKRAWRTILRRAGIENLRIHDLRRTLGSYMAISGESQYVIGKTLGHRDQRSTAVYARLNLEPVRRALDNVQNKLLS